MALIKNIGICSCLKRLSITLTNWSGWVLLLLGFLITGFLTFSFKSIEEVKIQNQILSIGKQIQIDVEAHLHVHEEVIRGAVALFEAADSVDRQKWHDYIQQINFKGLQGLGFALLIPPEHLLTHIAEIRREGVPEYNIWPGGTRDIYTSIVYLEFLDGRNSQALGFDMWLEPERRIAMEKARDENKAILTGKVTLAQESDPGIQPNILMFAPVYHKNMSIDTVEQRRAALFGWVYSPLDMRDLMRGINSVAIKETLRMKIFDGFTITPSALLYDSDEGNFSYADKLAADTVILHSNIGGRGWGFQFTPIAEYLNTGYSKTWLIAVGGSIINLLVFFLICSYRNTRRDALLIADNLIAELHQSEVRYHAAEAEFAKMEQQLQQSHKMEILGQLTGGIAHDFNNVLGIMLGYSNLALTRHVPDKTGSLAHHLKETIKAGERARELVAFMLTYSRTQADNLVEVVEPSPLVKEALKMLSVTIPSSIKLQSQIDKNVSYIRISSVELHQVVMNLIINARDSIATDTGRIEIYLSNSFVDESEEFCASCKKNNRGALCRGSAIGRFVSFSVTDNGCGISKEDLPLIFNPFFSTKEVGKGTGLGLSVVQTIVRRLGGCVLVDSQVGEGTTIQVLFPVAYDLVSSPSVTVSSSTVSEGKGARILVVDDEAALTHYLVDLLEGENYAVDAYTDSTKALNYFCENSQNIDAVITDQTMPNKTGIELAGAMLALRPDLPIFLCSGYSCAIDEKTAQSTGIRRFFYKPVSATELLTALNEAVNQPTIA